MLDAYIIEELKKQEEKKKQQEEQKRIQLPVPEYIPVQDEENSEIPSENEQIDIPLHNYSISENYKI